MSALPVADGPAMYLGGSMMTFALPMAAFIVIAGVLFYLYRRPHQTPRLKYMAPEAVAAVATREPGPVPAPAPKAAAATAPAAVVPQPVAPEVAVAEAKSEGEAIDAKQEEPEDKSEGTSEGTE